jgi:hypothetical protein
MSETRVAAWKCRIRKLVALRRFASRWRMTKVKCRRPICSMALRFGVQYWRKIEHLHRLAPWLENSNFLSCFVFLGVVLFGRSEKGRAEFYRSRDRGRAPQCRVCFRSRSSGCKLCEPSQMDIGSISHKVRARLHSESCSWKHTELHWVMWVYSWSPPDIHEVSDSELQPN